MENQKESKIVSIARRTSPENLAVEIFKEVKQSTVELSVLTTDHENYPTIKTLEIEIGRPAIKMFLVMMIEDCVRSLNINEPSKDQIIELANELINDNPTFKLEDFKIFFSNIKKGRYGNDYNRFDIASVYRMMASYYDDRSLIHEQSVIQKNKSLNADPAIRTNDISKMGDIYRKAIERGEKEFAEKKYAELRKRAIAKWKLYYDLHFNGVTITEELHNAYSELNPLNEEYIESFIKSI